MTVVDLVALLPLRFEELTAICPLRPLRSKADYDRVVEAMRPLLGRPRSSDEDDYLEVLGCLIRAYDEEHHPVPQATQGDTLRALIEDRGVTQAELSRMTGIADSNLSAMLHNRRGISRGNRAKLAEYFGVKPTMFVVD